MIPVTPPKGALMAYRLDPYSLDLLPSTKNKGKTMHDVVDPSIVFWHKRNPGAASPYTKGHSSASTSPNLSSCTTPQTPHTPHRGGHVTPPPCASASPVSTLRYVSVSSRTQRHARVIAPFRVAPGDEVVVRTAADTEVLGVVNAIGRADEIISPEKASSSLRLVRKAREGDRRYSVKMQPEVRDLLATAQRLLHNAVTHDDVSVHEGEFSLDGLLLYVAVSTEVADADLTILQRLLSNELKRTVRLINTLHPGSTYSSPNLSDCSDSVTTSSSRCPSVAPLDDDLDASSGSYRAYP